MFERLHRSLIIPSWPLALAIAVGSLTACGGSGSDTAADNPAGLKQAASGQLTDRVKTLLRQRRQAALAAGRSGQLPDGLLVAMPTMVAADAVAGTPTPTMQGTTVQEAGVDEADGLKARDGRLYAQDSHSLRDGNGQPRLQIRVARASADGSVQGLQDLPLAEPAGDLVQARGLLLAEAGTRLASMVQRTHYAQWTSPCGPTADCAGIATIAVMPYFSEPSVDVQLLALDSGGQLQPGSRLQFDGRLVSSRRVGNVVYLISTHTPWLAPERLYGATDAQFEAAVADLKLADILPKLRVDGGQAQPLLNESDCLLQPASSAQDIALTTVVAIDLASPTLERRAHCYLGGTEAVHMSAQHLVLATTRMPQPMVGADGRVTYPSEARTDLHRFAFDGLALRYRASGEVPGHLGWGEQRSAYRMGEHQGDLRVLSFTGPTGWATPADAVAANAPPPSPARLTVLRERAGRLEAIASLPNAQRPAPLGKPGEQIYGVRLLADRGYLVTFRQTDPLYVLDLSDPLDPKASGELEMPGYSDALLPMGNGLLLGVGRDANATGQLQGVKLALFDVADASRPAVLSSIVLGEAGSASAADASVHGVGLRFVGQTVRVALPVTLTTQAHVWSTAQHSLHRFEVDLTTRRMVRRDPPLQHAGADNPWDVMSDRSVQVGDTLAWFTQGRWVGGLW